MMEGNMDSPEKNRPDKGHANWQQFEDECVSGDITHSSPATKTPRVVTPPGIELAFPEILAKRRKMDSDTDSDYDWASSPFAKHLLNSPVMKSKSANQKSENKSSSPSDSFEDSTYGSLNVAFGEKISESNERDFDVGTSSEIQHQHSSPNRSSYGSNQGRGNFSQNDNSSFDSVNSSTLTNFYDPEVNVPSPSSPKTKTEHLVLNRLPGEKLGMILGVEGGREKSERVKAVIVRSVTTGGAAERASGSLRGVCVSDRILEVNGLDLRTLSHSECMSVFQEMPLRVVLTIQRAKNSKHFLQREESIDYHTANILSAPPKGFTLHDVIVHKGSEEPLGLSIVPSYGTTKNYYQIRRLLPSGPSAKCGQLHVGDRLIAYNNTSLWNLVQAECISILKQPTESVHFRILRPTNKGRHLKISVTKSGNKEIPGLDSASDITDTDTDNSRTTSDSEESAESYPQYLGEYPVPIRNTNATDVYGSHQFKLAYSSLTSGAMAEDFSAPKHDLLDFQPHEMNMSQNMENLVQENQENSNGLDAPTSDFDFLDSLGTLKSDRQTFVEAAKVNAQENTTPDLLLDFGDMSENVNGLPNLMQPNGLHRSKEFMDIPSISSYQDNLNQNEYTDIWDVGLEENNIISESDNYVPVTNIDDLLGDSNYNDQDLPPTKNGLPDGLADLDLLQNNGPSSTMNRQNNLSLGPNNSKVEYSGENSALTIQTETEVEQIFGKNLSETVENTEDGSISPFSSHSGSTVIQRTGGLIEEPDNAVFDGISLTHDKNVNVVTCVDIQAETSIPELLQKTVEQSNERSSENTEESLDTNAVVDVQLEASKISTMNNMPAELFISEEVIEAKVSAKNESSCQMTEGDGDMPDEGLIEPVCVSRDIVVNLDGAFDVPISVQERDENTFPELVNMMVDVCKSDDLKSLEKTDENTRVAVEEEEVLPSKKADLNASLPQPNSVSSSVNSTEYNDNVLLVVEKDVVLPSKNVNVLASIPQQNSSPNYSEKDETVIPVKINRDLPKVEKQGSNDQDKEKSITDFADSLLQQMESSDNLNLGSSDIYSNKEIVQENNIVSVNISRSSNSPTSIEEKCIDVKSRLSSTEQHDLSINETSRNNVECVTERELVADKVDKNFSHPDRASASANLIHEPIVALQAPRRSPPCTDQTESESPDKVMPEFVDSLVENLLAFEEKSIQNSNQNEQVADSVEEITIVPVQKSTTETSPTTDIHTQTIDKSETSEKTSTLESNPSLANGLVTLETSSNEYGTNDVNNDSGIDDSLNNSITVETPMLPESPSVKDQNISTTLIVETHKLPDLPFARDETGPLDSSIAVPTSKSPAKDESSSSFVTVETSKSSDSVKDDSLNSPANVETSKLPEIPLVKDNSVNSSVTDETFKCPEPPSPKRLPNMKAFTAKGFTPVKLNSLGASPIKTVSLDRRITTKLSPMSSASPLSGLNLQSNTQPQIKISALQTRSLEGPFQIDLLKGILGLGIKVVKRGQAYKVSEIQRGSSVDKNGNIRVGDYVLSINGTELTGLPDPKVQQILRLLPRGIVKVVFSVKCPENMNRSADQPDSSQLSSKDAHSAIQQTTSDDVLNSYGDAKASVRNRATQRQSLVHEKEKPSMESPSDIRMQKISNVEESQKSSSANKTQTAENVSHILPTENEKITSSVFDSSSATDVPSSPVSKEDLGSRKQIPPPVKPRTKRPSTDRLSSVEDNGQLSPAVNMELLSSAIDNEPFLTDVNNETVSSVVKDEPVSLAVKDEPVSPAVKDEPVSSAVKDEPVSPAVKDEPVSLAVKDEPVSLAVNVEPVSLAVNVEPVSLAVNKEPSSSDIYNKPVTSHSLQMKKVGEWKLSQDPSAGEEFCVTAYPVVVSQSPTPAPRVPRSPGVSKVPPPVSPRTKMPPEDTDTGSLKLQLNMEREIEPLDILDPAFKPSHVAKQFGTVKSPVSRKMSGLIDKFQHEDLSPDASTSPRSRSGSENSASSSPRHNNPFSFSDKKDESKSFLKSPPKVAPKPKRRSRPDLPQSSTENATHTAPVSDVGAEDGSYVALRRRTNPVRGDVKSETNLGTSRSSLQGYQRLSVGDTPANRRSAEPVFSTRSLTSSTSASSKLKGLQIPSKASETPDETTPSSTLQVNPSKLAPALRPRSGPAAFSRSQPKIHKISPKLNLAPIKLEVQDTNEDHLETSGETKEQYNAPAKDNRKDITLESENYNKRIEISPDIHVSSVKAFSQATDFLHPEKLDNQPENINETVEKYSQPEKEAAVPVEDLSPALEVLLPERVVPEAETEIENEENSYDTDEEMLLVQATNVVVTDKMVAEFSSLEKFADTMSSDVIGESMTAASDFMQSEKKENLEVLQSVANGKIVNALDESGRTSDISGDKETDFVENTVRVNDRLIEEGTKQVFGEKLNTSPQANEIILESISKEDVHVEIVPEADQGKTKEVCESGPTETVSTVQIERFVEKVEEFENVNREIIIPGTDAINFETAKQSEPVNSIKSKERVNSGNDVSDSHPAIRNADNTEQNEQITIEDNERIIDDKVVPTLLTPVETEDVLDAPPELPNSPPPPLPSTPSPTLPVNTSFSSFSIQQTTTTNSIEPSLPLALKRHQGPKQISSLPSPVSVEAELTTILSPDLPSKTDQLSKSYKSEFLSEAVSTSTPIQNLEAKVQKEFDATDNPLSVKEPEVILEKQSTKILKSSDSSLNGPPIPRQRLIQVDVKENQQLSPSPGTALKDTRMSTTAQIDSVISSDLSNTSTDAKVETDATEADSGVTTSIDDTSSLSASSPSPSKSNTLSVTSTRKWSLYSNKGNREAVSGSPNTLVTINPSEAFALPAEELALLLNKANGILNETNKSEDDEILVVVLHKDVGEKMGLSFKRGSHQEILVSDIDAKSTAGVEGHIKVNDRILFVNGKPVGGGSPHDVRVMLRTSHEQLVLLLARSLRPKTEDSSNISSTSTLQSERRSPTSRHLRTARLEIKSENADNHSATQNGSTNLSKSPRTPEKSSITISPIRDPSNMETFAVTMVKGVTGLGFCLEGGKGSPLGDRPVLIKRLFKGGAADKCGLIKEKDEILEVNGKSFEGLRHYEAWNFLKFLPDGDVKLLIRR